MDWNEDSHPRDASGKFSSSGGGGGGKGKGKPMTRTGVRSATAPTGGRMTRFQKAVGAAKNRKDPNATGHTLDPASGKMVQTSGKGATHEVVDGDVRVKFSKAQQRQNYNNYTKGSGRKDKTAMDRAMTQVLANAVARGPAFLRGIPNAGPRK